jgi:LmbE family N-acetylglucosaminyl deacetylase
MRLLQLPADRPKAEPLRILCIGAHCDDVEIGCGGTLMRLASERRIDVTVVTLCSDRTRAREARRSAKLFLAAARAHRLLVQKFRDGFLPAQWREVKECFESLKRLPAPDLIFTHERDDRHQDHRVACELTWNTFRNHMILEYEIAKFDGGLGNPNVFVPLSTQVSERKAEHLLTAYASQRSKRWFNREAFLGLMRLRGMESNAPDGLAEAFHARKVVL